MADLDNIVAALRGKTTPDVDDRTTDTTFTYGTSPWEDLKSYMTAYPAGVHTSDQLSQQLGYNDIKAPTPIDALEFVNSVEAFNDPWRK